MRFSSYLARIGIDGALRADAESLRRVHLAHRETFLFENITIQTGGSISLALADLERKFIDEGKGGYCFEHNTLFAAALREIGFTPATLLGRVRHGPPERWCRTHMVLRVPRSAEASRSIDGSARLQRSDHVLCDVGFGGVGLLEPIELRDGAESAQGGITYRLRRDDYLWVLSMRDADGVVTDLYEFADDPQTPWDVEVANHFTSTHPDSIFRRVLTVQRSSRAERLILRNHTVTRYRAGHADERPIDRAMLVDMARDLFGVTLGDAPLVCDQYPASKLTT